MQLNQIVEDIKNIMPATAFMIFKVITSSATVWRVLTSHNNNKEQRKIAFM